MCVTDVPHFKEVIIMSFTCDACGWRNVEVKGGGAVPPAGTLTELRYDPAAPDADRDMTRDVIKSDTSAVEIPEIELLLEAGSLGGMYTTVEGLLTAARDTLLEGNPFSGAAAAAAGTVAVARGAAGATASTRSAPPSSPPSSTGSRRASRAHGLHAAHARPHGQHVGVLAHGARARPAAEPHDVRAQPRGGPGAGLLDMKTEGYGEEPVPAAAEAEAEGEGRARHQRRQGQRLLQLRLLRSDSTILP